MKTKTHRHFVAFPLAVMLMLTVAALQHVLPVGAATVIRSEGIDIAADATPVDFESGWMMSGTLESDSLLRIDRSGESAQLVKGQALLRSSGLTHLRLATVQVHAFDASYVALLRDGSFTIVPLTAPVIVTDGSTERVVMPGMQLRVDSAGTFALSAIPPDWYAERLQALKLLPSIVIPALSAGTDHRSLLVSLVHTLTDGRITSAKFSEALGITRFLGPSAVAKRLLLLRLMQEESKTDADASKMISDTFANDNFLANELVPALPFLVTSLRKPVAEAYILLWQKQAVSLGLRDSEAMLSLLHTFSRFPEDIADAGYPKQSMLWQHAMSNVSLMLRSTVSGPARETLENNLAALTRADLPIVEESVVTPETLASITHWSEKELLAIVEDTLITHGVLMGSATVLAPDTPTQTVSVLGIFISENGSDIPYAFTYDVSHERLQNIIRDGKKLPNAVPVTVFFR